MRANDTGEFRPTPAREPKRGLIRSKAAVGQLDVQQPVVDVFRRRSLVVEQELLLRRLAEDAILHAELVVVQYDLFDASAASNWARSLRLTSYQKTMRWRSKILVMRSQFG